MTIDQLHDSIFLIITMHLEEEEIKAFSLANKSLSDKIHGNIVIKNRLLSYEFRIAQSIIREIKNDPYIVSQGFLATKEIKDGILINKEPDPMIDLQKIYTSTAYRIHNELYINKQFKLYVEQRKKIEKRIEQRRKEEELDFTNSHNHSMNNYYPPIDIEKFKAEINESSYLINYVSKVDNVLQKVITEDLTYAVSVAKATGKKFCPYYWFKNKKIL